MAEKLSQVQTAILDCLKTQKGAMTVKEIAAQINYSHRQTRKGIEQLMRLRRVIPVRKRGKWEMTYTWL